jgi:integration host factor subunit beta
MSKQAKLTRQRIAETLGATAGLKPSQARALTNLVIDTLATAIAAGNQVELRGLGTFGVRERKGRLSHNPRTLAPVLVPPGKTVFFRPCGKLKAAANTPGKPPAAGQP